MGVTYRGLNGLVVLVLSAKLKAGIAGTDGMTGAVLKLDVSDLHIPSNVASGMNVNSASCLSRLM